MFPVLLVLGFGFYYLNSLKDSASNARIEIASFKLNIPETLATGLAKLQTTIQFKVTNPLPVSITLKSSFFQIFYGGKQIASVNQVQPVPLKAGEATLINASVTITTTDVIAVIPSAIQEVLNKGIEVQITGKADFGIGTYTVNQNVKIV